MTPLLGDLRAHYDGLIDATWALTRRCVDRERGWAEAPSVERRFTVDCDEYTRHMAWMNHPSGGRRRARMTARQTAHGAARARATPPGGRPPRRPSTTPSA